MKKIKDWIINRLGGYTRAKMESCQTISRQMVWYDCKKYAESLYGENADEWCRKMYEYIERKCR